MTDFPKLHRMLVGLGAIQSFLVGFLLLFAQPLALSLFLSHNAAATLLDLPNQAAVIIALILSFVGGLLIFYGFVMVAVALRFDNRSIRTKGYGELISGGLFLWLYILYRDYLVITLALLSTQHILVGFTYYATTKYKQLPS